MQVPCTGMSGPQIVADYPHKYDSQAYRGAPQLVQWPRLVGLEVPQFEHVQVVGRWLRKAAANLRIQLNSDQGYLTVRVSPLTLRDHVVLTGEPRTAIVYFRVAESGCSAQQQLRYI